MRDLGNDGLKKAQVVLREPIADEIAVENDLEPILDSSIGTLSKGQRKRALLAIGLIVPRPILLADEPFDGLDLRQGRDVGRIDRRRTRR